MNSIVFPIEIWEQIIIEMVKQMDDGYLTVIIVRRVLALAHTCHALHQKCIELIPLVLDKRHPSKSKQMENNTIISKDKLSIHNVDSKNTGGLPISIKSMKEIFENTTDLSTQALTHLAKQLHLYSEFENNVNSDQIRRRLQKLFSSYPENIPWSLYKKVQFQKQRRIFEQIAIQDYGLKKHDLEHLDVQKKLVKRYGHARWCDTYSLTEVVELSLKKRIYPKPANCSDLRATLTNKKLLDYQDSEPIVKGVSESSNNSRSSSTTNNVSNKRFEDHRFVCSSVSDEKLNKIDNLSDYKPRTTSLRFTPSNVFSTGTSGFLPHSERYYQDEEHQHHSPTRQYHHERKNNKNNTTNELSNWRRKRYKRFRMDPSCQSQVGSGSNSLPISSSKKYPHAHNRASWNKNSHDRSENSTESYSNFEREGPEFIISREKIDNEFPCNRPFHSFKHNHPKRFRNHQSN